MEERSWCAYVWPASLSVENGPAHPSWNKSSHMQPLQSLHLCPSHTLFWLHPTVPSHARRLGGTGATATATAGKSKNMLAVGGRGTPWEPD